MQACKKMQQPVLQKQAQAKHAKKGIVFSLDAILALIAAITLITAAFFYLSQIHVIKWSQPNYFLISLDTLNVLRIDGTLQTAIQTQNPANLTLFFDHMYGPQVCGALEIYKKGQPGIYLNATKTGCNSYEEVYVFRSTIFVAPSYYYTVLKVWYQ